MMLFGLSCFFALETWLGLSCWMQAGYFSAGLVKLEVLELRDARLPSNMSRIAAFGLLRDGCPLNMSLTGQSVQGSLAILALGKPALANGYFIRTANDSADYDPVRWSVSASTNNGSSWQDVGASIWRLTTDGDTLLYPQLAFETPQEREQAVLFDLRRPWQWCLVSIVRGAVLLAGTLASLCYALAGREESAKNCWIVMFTVLGLCFILAAVGYSWLGSTVWRQAVETWVYVPECFVLPIGLAFYESRSIAVLFVFSALGALDSLLADCVAFGDHGRC